MHKVYYEICISFLCARIGTLDLNQPFNGRAKIWEPSKMKLIWGLQSWTLTGVQGSRTLSSRVHGSWEWRYQTRSTSRQPLQYEHGVGRTRARQILLKGLGTRACQDPRGACWLHDWGRAGMSLVTSCAFPYKHARNIEDLQEYSICCIEVLPNLTCICS